MATKYVRCCYIGCNQDAIVEYTLDTTIIPVCDDPIHVAIAPLFRLALLQGKSPETIKHLNPKRLQYKTQGETTPKLKVTCPKEKVTVRRHWVDDCDCWMNAQGQIDLLPRHQDDELLDSMHAIRQANFTRYSKTIAWLKDLYINNPPKYDYPEKELQVGRLKALTKLEQFREEAVGRGMLNL